MKTSLTALVIASSSVLAVAPATAQVQAFIDTTLTGVIHDVGTGTRALAGVDAEGSYVAIERLAEGQVSSRVWMDQLQMGSARMSIRALRGVRLTRLEGDLLAFDADPTTEGAERVTCSARLKLRKGQL